MTSLVHRTYSGQSGLSSWRSLFWCWCRCHWGSRRLKRNKYLKQVSKLFTKNDQMSLVSIDSKTECFTFLSFKGTYSLLCIRAKTFAMDIIPSTVSAVKLKRRKKSWSQRALHLSSSSQRLNSCEKKDCCFQSNEWNSSMIIRLPMATKSRHWLLWKNSNISLDMSSSYDNCSHHLDKGRVFQ